MIFFKGFSFSLSILSYLVLFIFLLFVIYKIGRRYLSLSKLSKIKSFINGIKLGFMSIKDIRNKLSFTIYTILIWACYLFMTIVCFYCFEEIKKTCWNNKNIIHPNYISTAVQRNSRFSNLTPNIIKPKRNKIL